MTRSVANEHLVPSAYDRLLLAFSNLRTYGIEPVVADGENAAEELDRIQGRIRSRFPDSTGCCLVVMRQDLSCFDKEGELRKPLLVHQRGVSVRGATRAALREFGLDTCDLDGETSLLVFDPRRQTVEEGESPLAGLQK